VVRTLAKDDALPPYTPGVIYFKSLTARADKLARAGAPASETQAGRVHMVGRHTDLENELVTYDGDGRSPNRYDAFVYCVIELRELWREGSTASADLAVATRIHEALREAHARETRRDVARIHVPRGSRRID
jgi:hypothetical protein